MILVTELLKSQAVAARKLADAGLAVGIGKNYGRRSFADNGNVLERLLGFCIGYGDGLGAGEIGGKKKDKGRKQASQELGRDYLFSEFFKALPAILFLYHQLLAPHFSAVL